MTMATFLLFSLILFTFSLSSSVALETFVNAGEVLSNSGYLSMALTLQLIFQNLTLNSSTAMIFAPSDIAFIQSGQPSLLQLQYHISPLRLSIESLKALPFSAKIPTLQSNHSLLITSLVSDGELSINGIKINESTIFDDGFLIIYGMDEFFNASFQITQQNLAPESSGSGSDSLDSASDFLRSRGFFKMATFLDLQLTGFTNETKLTIFAPTDEAIDEQVRNFSDFSSIFRRHVTPGLLRCIDLVLVDDGTMLPTFSDGFSISISMSGDVLVLNDVPVIFPDMHISDRLVVHGLNQLLMSPEKHESVGDYFTEPYGFDNKGNSSDYGES